MEKKKKETSSPYPATPSPSVRLIHSNEAFPVFLPKSERNPRLHGLPHRCRRPWRSGTSLSALLQFFLIQQSERHCSPSVVFVFLELVVEVSNSPKPLRRPTPLQQFNPSALPRASAPLLRLLRMKAIFLVEPTVESVGSVNQ
ncbi:hypothetical protein Ahy_B09g098909 isoform D [Arachis hypogaea]|uniref:Uncharacterized protein n=1 Tax=Arachis hypogaea TaxID=3818 RepID=A0A444XT99_ARAHY|nr:hypothetical protein Ahy_B09g098909 isoform D [Arachis hypogaea]